MRGRGQRDRERHDEQQHGPEHQKGRSPPVLEEQDAEGREQELAEGAGGPAEAGRERPPALSQELTECRKHDVEACAREAEADECPGGI
jgi:hypothetical protein